MTNATYPARRFQTPLLLPITVAVIGILSLGTAISGMTGPLCLALLAQFVLFLLLLRRPVWAMAALIVQQFTASDYMFSLMGMQITTRFLWTVLALLLLVPILRKKGWLKLGVRARRVIIPAAILVSIVTISNLVNTGVPVTMQYLRTNVTWLVILFLLPAVVKNEKDLKILAVVALVTASISAVVAVMQHYSVMGLPLFELLPGSYDGYRASGLAMDDIHLSFYLPLVLVPMIAIYFMRGVRPHVRKFLPLLALIILAGNFFTYTRSGIYSLAPALLSVTLIMKSKYKMRLLVVFLIFTIAFLGYSEMTGSRYSQGFSDDASAAGRLVMWSAGLNIARDYPLLGIGTWRFQEISIAYASFIDADLMRQQGAGEEVLGVYQAHDDFITVWTSFGTAALLVYLWLFVSIFRNFFESYRRSSTPFLRSFSLGCFGAFAAYVVIAATHNAMDSVMLFWILGGLSIATTKLAISKKPSKAKEIS